MGGAALLVAGLGVVAPARADTVAPHRLPAAALDPESTRLDSLTRCSRPSRDPVPDGRPIVVTIPPGPSFTVGKIPASWWRRPPYGDPGWQLNLRGFMWIMPLAQRAYDDGQLRSLKALVDQVVAFHAQNPDPKSNAAGWDEGTALRRLGAENCLYLLTKDSRLVKGMVADVAVQYSWRYYGPPNHGVHNHGAMADHAVIRAGELLGRKDWINRSLNRLRASAPGAWGPTGVNREQSSGYHVFNATLWGWVADDFARHRGTRDAGTRLVRGLVAKANTISGWLTEPDGKLTVYGNSHVQPGYRHPSFVARSFRDDVAGVAVGRWSWSDPRTSYYVIRYGPGRWAHGQHDRVGVTWSTQGLRVLVNPGGAPYDSKNVYRTYALSPRSHNVAYPDRGTFTGSPARFVSTVQKASWHTWNFTDAQFGVTHARQISVIRDTRKLVVKDTIARRAFRQYWHLDPRWAYRGRSRTGHSLWFTSGSHRLVVTTSGVGSVVAGATRPFAGWNFPTSTTRVKAAEIVVRATSTATTTFTVD